MKTDEGLIKELLPKGEIDKVLDVGGNDGELIEWLGFNGTILDIDRGAIRKARSLGHKGIAFDLNKRIPFPFKDNEFDLVICNNCLEHLIYPKEVISEIYRVTKNYAIIIVPNDLYRLSGRIRTLLGCDAFNLEDHESSQSPHIQAFSYKRITNLIRDAGFNNKKEILLGKPSLFGKNFSGSFSFLCSKGKTGKTETVRHLSLKSLCFR